MGTHTNPNTRVCLAAFSGKGLLQGRDGACGSRRKAWPWPQGAQRCNTLARASPCCCRDLTAVAGGRALTYLSWRRWRGAAVCASMCVACIDTCWNMSWKSPWRVTVRSVGRREVRRRERARDGRSSAWSAFLWGVF